MNEPVFENSMFTDDKSCEISIRAWVCIQDATTGALADSTELQYTENIFILNKFPSRCCVCIYIHIYIYIYIMSSDKALDSYREKGIHWNYNLTQCTGIGKSLFH